MLTKDQKKELVKDLSSKIKDAKSAVFVDFKGLKVNDMNALKKELRDAGVEMRVYKKTLMGIAFKEAGIDADVKGMNGQIAVSTSKEDEVIAAKIIKKFSKDNENIKITGGLLESKVMSIDEVDALAKTPGKEELLARLVATLNYPMSGFANVLGGNIRGLVQALKAISESK